MTIDGRTRDNHKEWFYSKNIKVFFFFLVTALYSQFIKKCGFLKYDLGFCFKYLQQIRVSAMPGRFFRTGSHQSGRPYTTQISLWFFVGLRARGHMGHMINSVTFFTN